MKLVITEILGKQNMKNIEETLLYQNLKSYMDIIFDEDDIFVVKRENGQNVVMMSENVYNNLIENSYLISSKANFDWLMESKAQLENKK